MWNLTVKNDYCTSITVLGETLKPGASITWPTALGNGIISIPGLTEVNFQDIGDKQIGGYSKATWGVLISFHGEEVVFRYEGGGQINCHINWIGQAELSGNGSFSKIDLPSFILPSS